MDEGASRETAPSRAGHPAGHPAAPRDRLLVAAMQTSPDAFVVLDHEDRVAAGALGVRYAFIELWVRDWSLVLGRLDERSPRVSQVASAAAPVPGTDWEFGTPRATLEAWQSQLVHPEHDWLRLDAEGAAEDNLSTALRYLGPDE